jgi:hypothetical protein
VSRAERRQLAGLLILSFGCGWLAVWFGIAVFGLGVIAIAVLDELGHQPSREETKTEP